MLPPVLLGERCDLHGEAPPELLSTYDAERHPGWFAAKESLSGPASALLENVPEQQKVSVFFPSWAIAIAPGRSLPRASTTQRPRMALRCLSAST